MVLIEHNNTYVTSHTTGFYVYEESDNRNQSKTVACRNVKCFRKNKPFKYLFVLCILFFLYRSTSFLSGLSSPKFQINFVILSFRVIIKINLLVGESLTFVIVTFFTPVEVQCFGRILLRRKYVCYCISPCGKCDESQFDFQQSEEEYLFPKMSKPAMGPKTFAVQCLLGALSKR
jgi:hypothetical protein